ncbi:MAG: hypothetical protein QM489_02540 [Candidatus Izemoplasma sp.]
MKKLFTFGLLAFGLVSLSACSDTEVEDDDNNIEELETPEQEIEATFEAGASIEETETLALLSYLTGGFLDFESSFTTVSYDFLALGDEDLVIEDELDEVNIYLEQLKVFMDDESNPMSTITVTESDLEEYDTLIKYSMDGEEYTIYFRLDPDTLEFVGLLIFNDIEFDLTGFTSLEYHERTQANDNPEATEEPNDINPSNVEAGEIVEKMVLRATNGDDYIEMVYLVDNDDAEIKTIFNMKKSIDGVESQSSIKIFEDEDGLQVKVDDGENFYNFKKEIGEDETVYQLNYRVDGTVGIIRITETVDEFGEVSYEYFINEAGKNKTIDKAAPKHSTDNDNGNNA